MAEVLAQFANRVVDEHGRSYHAKKDTAYRASGLTAVYLEGALRREPFFDGPAHDVLAEIIVEGVRQASLKS